MIENYLTTEDVSKIREMVASSYAHEDGSPLEVAEIEIMTQILARGVVFGNLDVADVLNDPDEAPGFETPKNVYRQ